MGQTGWWKRTKHSQVPPILTPSAARTRALGVRGFPVIYAHDGTGFMLRWLFAASTQKLVNITKACFFMFFTCHFFACVCFTAFHSGFQSRSRADLVESWGQQHKNATKVKASRWETQAALDPTGYEDAPDGLPHVYHNFKKARTKRLK